MYVYVCMYVYMYELCEYPNGMLHHHTQSFIFPVKLSVGRECFSAIGLKHLNVFYVCMYVCNRDSSIYVMQL